MMPMRPRGNRAFPPAKARMQSQRRGIYLPRLRLRRTPGAARRKHRRPAMPKGYQSKSSPLHTKSEDRREEEARSSRPKYTPSACPPSRGRRAKWQQKTGLPLRHEKKTRIQGARNHEQKESSPALPDILPQ